MKVLQSKPKFNNRKNEQLDLPDGRTIWHARSCAVVAEICMYHTQHRLWYVLLGERGSGTPDFQGYWGLPCGYLDWNETLCQAVIREVWEECGLHLPSLSTSEQFVKSNSTLTQSAELTDVPWAVTDHIDNTKQNISLHYAVLFAWNGSEFPALSNENADLNEVGGLAWVPIHEATQMILAFNHQKRIAKLLHEKPALFEEIASGC